MQCLVWPCRHGQHVMSCAVGSQASSTLGRKPPALAGLSASSCSKTAAQVVPRHSHASPSVASSVAEMVPCHVMACSPRYVHLGLHVASMHRKQAGLGVRILTVGRVTMQPGMSIFCIGRWPTAAACCRCKHRCIAEPVQLVGRPDTETNTGDTLE